MAESAVVTNTELKRAQQRGLESEVCEARAIAAHYDRNNGLLHVTLRGGATLSLPAHLLQGVAGASPELIEEVEVTPQGDGLHWEKLDADLLVQGIVAGSFGTRRWMAELEASGLLDTPSQQRQRTLRRLDELDAAAATMGRKGGRARTAAKTIAAQQNGKKGGRPSKEAETVMA